MKTRFHISASQVDSFLRCPRSWAWRYIAKIESEQAQATELGSRVHAIIEDFYLKGLKPDLNELWRFKGDAANKAFYPGMIALQMIQQVPRPEVKFVVEQPFEVEIGEVIYVGRVDLMFVRDRILYIVDHKTSSDPSSWGKKTEDLRSDPQALIYSGLALSIAEAGGLRTDNVQRVQFILNYGATDGNPKKGLLVHAPTEANPTLNRLRFNEEIQPIAEHMVQLRRIAADPKTLAASTDSCGVFGGCQFIPHCNLTVGERLKGIIMKNTLISELLAKAKGKPLDPIPADVPVAQVDVNPPEVPEEVYQQTAEEIAQGLSQRAPEKKEEVAAAPAPEKPVKAKAPKKAPEPVVEKAPEPVVEKAPEPVVEKAPEPAVANALRAVMDSMKAALAPSVEEAERQELKERIEAAAAAGRLAGLAHANGHTTFGEIDELLDVVLKALR